MDEHARTAGSQEHHAALGAVAAAFGELEMLLFVTACGVASLPQPVGQVLLGSQPFSSVVDRFSTLCALRHGDVPVVGAVREWASAAKGAAARRNKALHAAWIANSPADQLSAILVGRKGDHRGLTEHTMTVRDLDDLADEVHGLSERLSLMLRPLGCLHGVDPDPHWTPEAT